MCHFELDSAHEGFPVCQCSLRLSSEDLWCSSSITIKTRHFASTPWLWSLVRTTRAWVTRLTLWPYTLWAGKINVCRKLRRVRKPFPRAALCSSGHKKQCFPGDFRQRWVDGSYSRSLTVKEADCLFPHTTYVCSQSGTKAILGLVFTALTLCPVRRRPQVQPYVMASGVTKSGTTNGHPLKAQLQIIGESIRLWVCTDTARHKSFFIFPLVPAAASCFGSRITNFCFFFVHLTDFSFYPEGLFTSLFCSLHPLPPPLWLHLCVSLLQCYLPSWKRTRRTGLVPVPTWRWRWTASLRRRRNAATPTAPNGSSRSLCESELSAVCPLLSFPGRPCYDINLLASLICFKLIRLTSMLKSSTSHNSPSHAHPVARNLLVVTLDFVLGLWTWTLNRSKAACLFLLQLIIGDELFTT